MSGAGAARARSGHARATVKGGRAHGPGAAALEIVPPKDYVLWRDACSYGYFVLEPNLWQPATGVFRRVLDLGGDGGAVAAEITQPGGRRAGASRGKAGAVLRIALDRALSPDQAEELERQVRRMLRLDEPASRLREFHAVDARWKGLGRGRLMRSPSLFEDVIKTVTSCNVAWPSTVRMNARLCAEYGRESAGGGRAFPTAAALAGAEPARLRARCGVGYRDARIVELARLFDRGLVAEASLSDPTLDDAALERRLIDLPGIGPYAARNIMQLMGRYGRIPLDSETVRHARTILGYTGTDRRVLRRLEEHFEPMGRDKFRSYWFEMWAFYEAKRGPSWTWERDRDAAAFTAAAFRAAQDPAGARSARARARGRASAGGPGASSPRAARSSAGR
ncbi:MAG: hypothetical protein C0475_09010 [Planctomyces sp.]|nr:hypothetical protein [Planctomyces sp.]MBA4039814.1 hypothetical protein [Planctomyces sp.]